MNQNKNKSTKIRTEIGEMSLFDFITTMMVVFMLLLIGVTLIAIIAQVIAAVPVILFSIIVALILTAGVAISVVDGNEG